MSQRLIQTTEQQQVQRQQLSAQQLLQIHLLTMPVAQLEQAVQAELDDNPALETESGNDDFDEGAFEEEKYEEGEFEEGRENDDAADDLEREDRQEALDNALQSLNADDMMDDERKFGEGSAGETTFYEPRSEATFYDVLRTQMGELRLSNIEQNVMEYLIGSLDNDGLLRKPLTQIADEMAIYHNIDVPDDVIAHVLSMLQTFDPAGIGARNLQECLLIQVKRMSPTPMQQLMQHVLKQRFNDFIHNRWQRIQHALHLNEEQTAALQQALRRLNPKPGAALSESSNNSAQHVTPDFIVSIDEQQGTLHVQLNRGNIPQLYISATLSNMVKAYQNNRAGINRTQKEALLYSKEKVERAKSFIKAVQQRHHTLLLTMQTIAEWQRQFFIEGDESLIRPMILKDIAEKTQLHSSTISRACANKYVQTPWGIFPLRHLFSDSYTTETGQQLSKHEIKDVLQAIINAEDKNTPLSDEELQKTMAEKGYPIARRTIAKYRTQLHIPVARLRKS